LREEIMLEYMVYALLGLVMAGGLLYVTMCSEAEEPPRANRPDRKPVPDNSATPGAAGNE
jgi:hypothetical protein